jgi:hypothetical protein
MKYFLSALCLVCFSCTKHADDIYEHIPNADLQFSKPTAGQVFYTGDSIEVRATAVSRETIHGYDVYLTKHNDTMKLYQYHAHEHNDTLFINKKFRFINEYKGAVDAHVVLKLDHNTGHNLHQYVICTVK